MNIRLCFTHCFYVLQQGGRGEVQAEGPAGGDAEGDDWRVSRP